MRKITLKDNQRASLLLKYKEEELENDEKHLCYTIMYMHSKGKEIADVQYHAFKTLYSKIINNW